MRSGWRILLIFIAATSLLGIGWNHSAKDASFADSGCQRVPSPPWLNLPKAVEADSVPDLSSFLETLNAAIGPDRLSGTWFGNDGDALTLHLGITSPTEADVASVLHALKGEDSLDGVPLVLVDVPLGSSELSEIQEKVDAVLTEQQVEYTSTVRPDLGILETEVWGTDTSAVTDAIGPLAERCIVSVLDGEERNRYAAMVGRSDQPPYKAGKRIHVLVRTGGTGETGTDSNCTAGFVFETEGEGEQPLRQYSWALLSVRQHWDARL